MPKQGREPANGSQSTVEKPFGGVLWKSVKTCLINQRTTGFPQPCFKLELSHGVDKGYAVWKDMRGSSHFLLIPTIRLTGIEDPDLLKPTLPNYWEGAWKITSYVTAVIGKKIPRDYLGLGINSPTARSQDQLHIHADCLVPGVRELFKKYEDEFTSSLKPWSQDKTLRVMKIESEDLHDYDAFKILAKDLAGHEDEMQLHALIAVGAIFKDGTHGFYLIDVNRGEGSGGEFYLDRTCKIAKNLH
jgi:CDP-diacylglycerol pyrophosphatase